MIDTTVSTTWASERQSLLGKRLHKDSEVEGLSSDITRASKLARQIDSSATYEEEELSASQKACIKLFS